MTELNNDDVHVVYILVFGSAWWDEGQIQFFMVKHGTYLNDC